MGERRISKFVRSTELNPMLEALRKVPTIKVDRDHSQKTVIVTHVSGTELLRGIEMKRGSKVYLVRHVENLFM